MESIAEVIDNLLDWPPGLTYLALGLGAALENLFPPAPADTFVILGAFVAARGSASVPTVFWVTWASNVGAAMAVYWAGRKYGLGFFEQGVGRYVLNRAQMRRIRGFYHRWGTLAIFFTRFVPGVRAVIPVFAGISGQTAPRVLFPLALASGLWHLALVFAGATAGRNLEYLLGVLADANRWLIALGGLLLLAVAGWWWYTRREEDERQDGAPPEADG